MIEETTEADYSPAKKCRMENFEVGSSGSASTSSSSVEKDDVPRTPAPNESGDSSAEEATCSKQSSEFLDWMKSLNIPVQNNDIQNPRQLLRHLVPGLEMGRLPANVDDFDICRLIYELMTNEGGADQSAIASLFLAEREKIDTINTIEECVDLIEKSSNIVVLTGAGCSVSCGIPDFRSRDGVYARLHVDFPDLPDPAAMFDIFYFEHDPRPFFKFAKEIYPGQFKPSLSHKFIKKIEEHGKLLRNYTQNIDTLEMTAEIKNVIQCHGKKRFFIIPPILFTFT